MKTLSRTLIAGSALLALQAAANPRSLDVSLDVEPLSNGNVKATVTFTNTGVGQQKLLSWYTDLAQEHIFHVSRDGIEVQYEGPHYKRPAPSEKDYIKLAAGQSLSKSFELTAMYDMSQAGNYEVSYDVSSYQLFGETVNAAASRGAVGFDNVAHLQSKSVDLWVEGLASRGSNTDKKRPGGGASDCVNGTCFTGRCDNGQKTDILSALNAADQITNDAVSYLSSHSANNTSARYETWFGAPTSNRYATASAHFNAINDTIDNQQITFDCSCNQSYFAYVYPNQPYTVYLCRAFWSANELGTDSRAGTIVHELSHFNVVAGTDDVVYGQSGAKNLAITDPDQALNNADSHEYFAENTPHQN